MSNQEVETSSSKSDLLLVTLAALLAIAGVVGFALLSEEALAIRLGVLGALYGPLARKRSIRPA